uniref:Uncharacterized protein n=1 Tax=Panagrolaimus davidi TaxID=227884 RepID=A0A914QW98_9BILA
MNNRPNDRRPTAPPARGGSNNYDRQDRGKYQFDKDQDDRNFDHDDSRNIGGNYGRLPPRNSQRTDDDYPQRMNEAPARNDRIEPFDPRLPQSDYSREKGVEGDYRQPKRTERDGYNDEYPDSKDRQLWNHCDRESKKYNEDKNNYDSDLKVSQNPSRGFEYNDPNNYDNNAKSSRPPSDNRNYDYEDEQRGYRNSATNYRDDNLPQRNRDSRSDDSAPPSTRGRNLRDSFDDKSLRSGAGRGDLYERDYGYSKVDESDNFSSGVIPKAPPRSNFDNPRQSDYKSSKYENTPQRNDYGYDAKRDDGYDRPQREAFPTDVPRREGYGGDISGRGDRPAATRNSNFAGEREGYASQRSARNEMETKNRYNDEEDSLAPNIGKRVPSTGCYTSDSADRGCYSSPPPRSGYNAAGRDVAPPRLYGKDDYGPPRNTEDSRSQYTYRSMRGDGYGERRPARDEINGRSGYDRASNNEDKQPVRGYSDQQGNGYAPSPPARRPAPYDYRSNNNQTDYSRGYNNQCRDDSNGYKNNQADNRSFNSRGGYDNSNRGTLSNGRGGISGTFENAEGFKTSNTSRPEASVKGGSYQTPNIGNTSTLGISRPTAAATLCPRLPAPINTNPNPPKSNDQSRKSPPPPSSSAAAPSKIADDDWD